jgi:hypothetical protein
MPPLPAKRRSAESALSQVKPPEGLAEREIEIARLMTFGSPDAQIVMGADIPAGWPMTLEQAARFVGYRIRKARRLASSEEFIRFRGSLMRELRQSEGPRNLATAIRIRDDEGDGSAATKTAQLKACQFIEGPPEKGGVTVNVNQQTNVAAITPGYVIRLGKFAQPEGEPRMIEGDAK